MDKPTVMKRLPPPIASALAEAAGRWNGLERPWLVGGSCGLVLHGVRVASEPRDLDVYVDAPDAPLFHRAMSPFAVDEQQPSETALYRSILSHYRVGGVLLELVAGFEVRTAGAEYRVEVPDLLASHALRTDAGGAPVGVMPLAHELAFNMLRGREDRYTAVAEAMCRDPARHIAALRLILARNRFDGSWVRRMAALLGVSPEVLAAGEV